MINKIQKEIDKYLKKQTGRRYDDEKLLRELVINIFEKQLGDMDKKFKRK